MDNTSTLTWQEKQRQKQLGYLIRFLAVIIWGVMPIFLKYTPAGDVPADMRSALLALGGAFISILVLLLFLAIGKKQFWRPKITINGYFVMIIISQAVFLYLMNSSLSLTASTHFILFNNFAPIFALLVAVLLWRNEIPYLQDKQHILWVFLIFLLGSLGSSLLFANTLLNPKAGNITGDLFALAAMVLDVMLVVSQIRYAKYLESHQSIFLNFYVSVAVFVLLIPSFFLHSHDLSTIPATAMFFAFAAGILGGLGQILNYEAFRRMDGFIAFLMFNISIFITFTLEAFILKEIFPTILLLAGGSMIIGASIVAEVINTRCEKKQDFKQ